METRLIQREELPKLLALYEHLHTNDSPLPARAIVEDVWARIQIDPGLQYFGAFDGEQLVSTCTLTIVPNLTRGCRPYGLIENVVTAPSHRRRGLGKGVLQFALQFAWTSDCYKVMLLTGRMDEGTFAFYESAGFVREAKEAFLASAPQE